MSATGAVAPRESEWHDHPSTLDQMLAPAGLVTVVRHRRRDMSEFRHPMHSPAGVGDGSAAARHDATSGRPGSWR